MVIMNRQVEKPFDTCIVAHELCYQVPRDYAVRVCKEFAQLGARGISVMFSSGDGGVGDGDADPATQTCFTNDGLNTTRFIPLFPARYVVIRCCRYS